MAMGSWRMENQGRAASQFSTDSGCGAVGPAVKIKSSYVHYSGLSECVAGQWGEFSDKLGLVYRAVELELHVW